MPVLTKSEVDEYVTKYYPSLKGSLWKFSLRYAVDAEEVISEWYLRLLVTEQKAAKYHILSHRGLNYFAGGFFLETRFRHKNKYKRPLTYISSYADHDMHHYDEVLEKLIFNSEIKELYEKVSNLKRGAWDAHRNIRIEVPNKALQRTFANYVAEVNGPGGKESDKHKRYGLIKGLKEAYGVA
jgi:hypothetical protein